MIASVVTGADGPYGFVGDNDGEHLLGRYVHQILHELHRTYFVVQPKYRQIEQSLKKQSMNKSNNKKTKSQATH